MSNQRLRVGGTNSSGRSGMPVSAQTAKLNSMLDAQNQMSIETVQSFKKHMKGLLDHNV